MRRKEDNIFFQILSKEQYQLNQLQVQKFLTRFSKQNENNFSRDLVADDQLASSIQIEVTAPRNSSKASTHQLPNKRPYNRRISIVQKVQKDQALYKNHFAKYEKYQTTKLKKMGIEKLKKMLSKLDFQRFQSTSTNKVRTKSQHSKIFQMKKHVTQNEVRVKMLSDIKTLNKLKNNQTISKRMLYEYLKSKQFLLFAFDINLAFQNLITDLKEFNSKDAQKLSDYQFLNFWSQLQTKYRRRRAGQLVMLI